MVRGVAVEAVADSASDASDMSDGSDGDLDLRNFSSVKASEPMSLKGDSDRDSRSAMVMVMGGFW